MNRAAKRPNTVKQERNWAKSNNITIMYSLWNLTVIALK